MLCVAIPFAFLKYKPKVFEYITVFSVSLVSLLSVLGYPTDILIPVSYLTFGLMWTNRILTTCQGALYLVTPIWAYDLLHTFLASWTGLFNSILPAVMGVFTVWFEKWYLGYYVAGGRR